MVAREVFLPRIFSPRLLIVIPMPHSKRESPWLVCLLPFVVFMAITSFEPKPPPADGKEMEKPWHGINIDYKHYPCVYSVKILATAAAMVFVWPGYRKYSRRLSWMAVVIGVVGAVLW